MSKLFRSLISLIVLLLPNPVLAQVDTILGIKFVCSGSQITLSHAIAGGTWVSANTAVATIGSSGVVTGVSSGTSTISYLTTSDTATTTVTVNPLPHAGSISGSASVSVGNKVTLSSSATGGSWASSNSSIASVADLGGGNCVVYGFGIGNATISYTVTNGCGSSTTTMGLSGRRSTTIHTIAGNNTGTFAGDGGPAIVASLRNPNRVAVDNVGNLYISDLNNNRVRKVDKYGFISTVAGTDSAGFAGDGGAATNAELNGVTGISIAPNGAIIVSDGGNHRIRKIDAAGIITTIAGDGSATYGGDGGAATAASLHSPYGTSFDLAGNMYISDVENDRVRKVSPSGTITTFAGTGTSGFSGDGGPATAAMIGSPWSVAADASGNVFIADRFFNTIRKVSNTGIITTYAGDGFYGFYGDGGPATAGEFRFPDAIALDDSGNLYVAEEGSDVIRMVSAAGIISTLAGSPFGASGYSGDGGPATAAVMNLPTGVAVDNRQNVYVADYANHVVRVVGFVNKASYFTRGNSTSLSVCQGTTMNSVNAALEAFDLDTSLPIMWAAVAAPTHGTLSGFPGSVVSISDSVQPSGITYTPDSGYSGTDTFRVRVHDGFDADTISVYVTVHPIGPILGNGDVCSGLSVTLSDAVAGGSWTSGTTGVATIGSTGIVAGIAAGTTSITYTMPSGCAVYKVVSVFDTLPIVSAVSQLIAAPASSVVITGHDFGSSVGNNIVYFGATRASVSAASTTSLTVVVPIGATFNSVSVNNQACALVGSSRLPFLPTYDNTAFAPGAVNFSSKIDFAAGTLPSGVGLTDVDGDGKTDVVIANSGSNIITIYRNTASSGIISSGSFATGVNFATGSTPAELAIADVDGDGRPDILVSNSGDSTVSVFRNTATVGVINSSSLAAAVTFNSGISPAGLKVADLDADGKPDMLVANTSSFSFSILRNTSTMGAITGGSFAAMVPISTGADSVGQIALADVDGDGKLDVLTLSSNDDSLIVYRNTSSHGIINTSSLAAKVAFGAGARPLGLATGDFDGDGKIDVAVANNVGNSISVFRNTATTGSITAGSFAGKVDFAAGTGPHSVSIADFDGDGRPDIAATNGTANILVLRNTASSGSLDTTSFAAGAPFGTAVGAKHVAAGDIDGDQKADLVVNDATGGQMSVLRNNPIGHITGTTSICQGTTATLSNSTTGGRWHSSNVLVATIDSMSGIATGAGAGTATISYRMPSGVAVTAVVTIISVPTTGITGSGNIIEDSTTVLSAEAGGIWSSSNTAIAVVGSVGIVTGVSPGTALISYSWNNVCATGSFRAVLSVRAASVAPVITTFAGNNVAGYGGDGDTAVHASIHFPAGIATDRSGALYIADRLNAVVRKVSATGVITTIAGNGLLGTSGDGGAATAARFLSPVAIAIDTSGNVYIADDSAHTVRVVHSSGIISRFAGNGTSGYSGDGGPATAATLSHPTGLTFDATGTLFIADAASHVVRRVSVSGTITTVAGNGVAGFVGDGGPATAARLSAPSGVAFRGNNLYIADYGNRAIRMVDAVGTISTKAGTTESGYSGDNEPATVAKLSAPYHIAFDMVGNMYITDRDGYNVVRRVDTNGIITTFAGNRAAGYRGDSAAAVTAYLNRPWGVATDTNGVVYISDCNNHVIRNIVSSTNNAPVFVGGSPRVFAACMNSGTTPLDSFLTVADADSGQTLTWSVDATPAHGTVAATYSTVDTGASCTPTGITYTPDTSFSGNDTFSVSVNDGATYTEVTFYVTVHSLPSAIRGTNSLCIGAASTLSSTTGSGTWASSNPSVVTIGSTSGSISGGSTGTSIVSYVLPTGCGVADTISVHPLPASITSPGSLCAGTTDTLGNADTGGVWSNRNTAMATIGASTGVITGIAGGTDTFSYTLSTGCSTSTTVIIHPSLPIQGVAGACVGLTTLLTDSVAGGTWSSSDPSVATINSVGSVTGVTVGTGTITYTTANGCAQILPIAISALPSAVSGAMALCAGDTATLSNTVSGGTWSSAATSVATVASSSGLVTGVTGGTTTISYATGVGCAVTASVTVHPNLPITGGLVTCIGVTISLASGTPGGTWSSSNTAVATVGSASGAVRGIIPGTAIITYSHSSGCYRTATVSVGSTAPAITGIRSVCATQTTLLGNPISGGTWSSSNNSQASVGLTTGLVTGVAASIPTITYTLGPSCKATAVVTVLALRLITGPTSVCSGQRITLANALAGGTWSSSATSIASVGTGAGIVNALSGGLAIISYSMPTGCVATHTVTINALADITGPTTVCATQTISLNNAVAGGTWSSNYPSIASVNAATGVVHGVAASGAVVTITYTLPTGCKDTSRVTVQYFSPIVTGPASVCEGATVTVGNTVTGGRWSTSGAALAVGSATGIVSGLSPGVGAVSYTLTNGCAATKVMTVNPLQPITGAPIVCAGQSTTLANTVPSGTWVSSLPSVASINATTGVVTGIAGSGSPVTITYTLPTGCRDTAVIRSHYRANITGSSSVCEQAIINLSNSVAGGTWSSSNTATATVGLSTGWVTGLSAGAVTISYALPSGCLSTHTATVQVVPQPITGSSSVCRGLTVTLSSATPGGNWSSSHVTTANVGAATGIVTGLAVSSTVPTITYTMPGTGCFDTVRIFVVSCGKNNGEHQLEAEADFIQGFTVLPNPNNGLFRVVGIFPNGAGDPANIRITDLLGKVVYETMQTMDNGQLDTEVNLGKTMASGIYLLQISSGKTHMAYRIILE